MKNRITAYWIVTGLFCLIFTLGGVANLMRAEFQREIMEAFGFPTYMMTILGVAKVLGVIALLIPGQPILKD